MNEELIPKKQLSPLQIEELRNYKFLVEERAIFESDEIFPNSNEFHASIVLTSILKNSVSSVYIYDDNLCGDISDRYDLFEEFIPTLESQIILGRRIKIALKEVPKGESLNSKIYSVLKKYSNHTNLEIRIASEDFINNIKNSFNQDIRFAVADSKMFRYETVVNARRAYCSFNNKVHSQNLEQSFVKQFENSPKLVFNENQSV
jgi:hypothetical protein